MIAWSRIRDGWAVNLDGTDAALVFSLPRIEVRSSPRGWQTECFHEDGTKSGGGPAYPGGSAAAKGSAISEATRLLPAHHAAALKALFR